MYGARWYFSSNLPIFVATFTSRVVKNGSVVSILRVLTKRGGDDEKTAGVSAEIMSREIDHFFISS